MVAALIEIADAVVADLNAASAAGQFAVSFVARRLYLAKFTLTEMQNRLHVTVVPNGDDGELFSRSKTQHEYTLDVAVQEKPVPLSTGRLDQLLTLTQQIGDYFRFRALSGRPERWIKTALKTAYSPEHLDQLQQFTSLLSLTFLGHRE